MIQQLKVLLLVIALFSTNFLFGQTQKHKVPVGGAISGNVQISDLGTYTAFGMNTSIGYFLSDGILAKTQLGFNYTASENSSGSDYLSYEYIVGLGARYYFKTGKLQPLLGANINYVFISTPSVTPSFSRGRYEPSLELGGSYFINENIAIEITAPFMGFSSIDLTIGTQIYLR